MFSLQKMKMWPLSHSAEPLHSIYVKKRRKKKFALEQLVYQDCIKRNGTEINVQKYKEVGTASHRCDSVEKTLHALWK